MGVRGQHLVRLEALWRREQWRQSKPERWTQYLQTAKGKKAHLCWEATKEWTGRCSWEMKMRWKRILNSGLIDQVDLAQAEDTDNFPKGRATSWESSDMSLRSIWLLYKGRQGYCLNNATPWALLKPWPCSCIVSHLGPLCSMDSFSHCCAGFPSQLYSICKPDSINCHLSNGHHLFMVLLHCYATYLWKKKVIWISLGITFVVDISIVMLLACYLPNG